LACKGEYAGVVIRRCGLGVIDVSEPIFFTWSEAVPELLHDIHELAGPMVYAPAAVRSFLHSSEEYILAIEQARVKHMIHNTHHCVHLTEIGAILMDVSENEILFLHYYHINQPFLRRQLISILTDRQKYS
jgi:hypothetical protein